MSSDGTDLRARLIALAVHDLRNPLASILGNAEYLVQARELGPDSREAAADLLAAARLMARGLGELRAVNRAVDGDLHLEPTIVDAAEVAAAVAHDLEPRASRAGVELVARAAPAKVLADRSHLRHVIEELCDCALRGAPAGTLIEIVTGGATISIRDRRQPPPPDDIARMFEVDSEAGLGRRLGLLFCRLVAESMGGTVSARLDSDGAFATVLTLPSR